MTEEPVELTREEARGGVNISAMRYVLFGSITLVVAAFAVIYFIWG